jgi:tetratricopeptide (TPR) repeat protein
MGREILEYAWVNKALLSFARASTDEAIKAFDKAIELNPQYADAWSNKGIALYDQGKCERLGFECHDYPLLALRLRTEVRSSQTIEGVFLRTLQ